jgi:hypothetical protein
MDEAVVQRALLSGPHAAAEELFAPRPESGDVRFTSQASFQLA